MGVSRGPGARLRRLVEGSLAGLAAPPEPPSPRPSGGLLLSARGVGVDLGGRSVLSDVDLEVRAGELVALVGPNGAGKSSLLGALTGDLPAARGEVLVHERAMATWSPIELAQRRAVLPQQVTMTFPFEVGEVVRMGRSPWAGTSAEDDDEAVVAAALAEVDATHLAGRRFTTLSGGESARVALARVLAQATQLLLLDEPTAALDLQHQELVLRSARGRVAGGHGAVVVLHDLGLASAYADRVVLLADGRVRAQGSPREVLTSARITEVYRHPVEVLDHPTTGAQMIVPVRTHLSPEA